jgi:hypothetical protein
LHTRMHVCILRACSRAITYILQPSIYFLEHPPAHGKYLKYRTLSTAISHSRQLLPTANIRMSLFTSINTLKRTFVGKVVGFIQKDLCPEGHSLYFKRPSSESCRLPSKIPAKDCSLHFKKTFVRKVVGFVSKEK